MSAFFQWFFIVCPFVGLTRVDFETPVTYTSDKVLVFIRNERIIARWSFQSCKLFSIHFDSASHSSHLPLHRHLFLDFNLNFYFGPFNRIQIPNCHSLAWCVKSVCSSIWSTKNIRPFVPLTKHLPGKEREKEVISISRVCVTWGSSCERCRKRRLRKRATRRLVMIRGSASSACHTRWSCLCLQHQTKQTDSVASLFKNSQKTSRPSY